MKKLLQLLIFTPLLLGAQETVRSEQSDQSPTMRHDNSVLFSLNLPRLDTPVKIEGSFLKSSTEMDYDPVAGCYFFQSEPLEPDLYTYNFQIGNTTISDPRNIFTMRDITRTMNYFIVPGGSPLSISNLVSANDVAHGTVSEMWLPANGGSERRTLIYLPPGYEQTPEQRYPVLYLLHGTGGDETSWSELGRAVQILDNLISQGKCTPVIVVMPNGNPDETSAPGFSGMDYPVVQKGHWMDGTFEAGFPEIVALTDARFRTIADAEHRAVAGLSMGGFNAMNLSRIYPDEFAYVGLFSAAMLNHGHGDSDVFSDEDTRLRRQMEGPLKFYWIGIGKDDFLYADNVEYRAKLDGLGFPYTYHESEGGHQWQNWRDYLSIFLQMIFQ